MQSAKLKVSELTHLSVLGTRFLAKRLRGNLEEALSSSPDVELDLEGINLTQSFADELLGPIALRMGPELLDRIAFKNCSEGVKAVIHFVLASRLDDFERMSASRRTHDTDLKEA